MRTRGYADATADGIRTKNNMSPPPPMVGGHKYQYFLIDDDDDDLVYYVPFTIISHIEMMEG